MILKFHNGWEKWKYIDGIQDPEIEVVAEDILAFRLGYTLDRLNGKECNIIFADTDVETWHLCNNYLELLEYIPPIDCLNTYPGQVEGILFQKQPNDNNSVKLSPACKDGQLMLAIRCSRGNEKHNIFTNCETYLLNDAGKTLNRLL